MERYVHQLIEDIRHAKANVPQPWWTFVDHDESPLNWNEDYQSAPRKSIEEWTGLKKMQFPPVSYLNESQTRLLLAELKDLLGEYNCHVVFQVSVPEALQYEVIRTRFDQQSPMPAANMHFFEFCDPATPKGQCQLGDYCHCRFFDDLLSGSDDTDPNVDPEHYYLLEEERNYLDAIETDAPYLDDLYDNDEDDLDGLDWDEDEEDDDWHNLY